MVPSRATHLILYYKVNPTLLNENYMSYRNSKLKLYHIEKYLCSLVVVQHGSRYGRHKVYFTEQCSQGF